MKGPSPQEIHRERPDPTSNRRYRSLSTDHIENDWIEGEMISAKDFMLVQRGRSRPGEAKQTGDWADWSQPLTMGHADARMVLRPNFCGLRLAFALFGRALRRDASITHNADMINHLNETSDCFAGRI